MWAVNFCKPQLIHGLVRDIKQIILVMWVLVMWVLVMFGNFGSCGVISWITKLYFPLSQMTTGYILVHKCIMFHFKIRRSSCSLFYQKLTPRKLYHVYSLQMVCKHSHSTQNALLPLQCLPTQTKNNYSQINDREIILRYMKCIVSSFFL